MSYKIAQIKDNEIMTIYVFSINKSNTASELSTLFEQEPDLLELCESTDPLEGYNKSLKEDERFLNRLEKDDRNEKKDYTI